MRRGQQLLIACLAAIVISSFNPLWGVSFEGKTMGTTYRVSYSPSSGTPSVEKLKSKVDERLRAINQAMSTYIPESEISRFNRLPAARPMQISSDFATVLSEALGLSRKTDGVFDPTIGPLLRLFAIGANAPESVSALPGNKKLNAVQKLIGYRKVDLRSLSKRDWEVQKKVAGVELDLSAIAKGYGVDAVYHVLESFGVSAMLVEIGGELRASRDKGIEGNEWRVAIERPDPLRRDPLFVLPLVERSIATSGNFRNLRVIGGKKVGHVFDPRKLEYRQTSVVSVSVLGKNCMMADAWATVLLAMPKDKAFKLAEKYGLEAAFVVWKNNRFQLEQTSAFSGYLETRKARS